jgi:hypothetical protein
MLTMASLRVARVTLPLADETPLMVEVYPLPVEKKNRLDWSDDIMAPDIHTPLPLVLGTAGAPGPALVA